MAKKETKTLIKESLSLNENQKSMYLAIVELLPAEKQEEIRQIFEKEAEKRTEIEAETKKKKSEKNSAFMSEMESTYKFEKKKAIEVDEKNDKNDAAKLLDDLNKL